MKIASRKPMSSERYVVRLLTAVAFDGNVVPAGSLVELSDRQVIEILCNERGVAAEKSELAASSSLVIHPRAVMEWADDSLSPRQRKKWRPSRIGSNRMAPRGSVRLDVGSGIIEQVRGLVGR
ncbi:MAG: hypothetical protein ACTHL5_11360 [Rhodanobacter sp.]